MPERAWGDITLEEVAVAIKDGTHGSFHRVRKGVPFLSAKNVTEQGSVMWDNTDDCVSEEDYLAITSAFSPRKGDILITIVGTLGRRAMFDGDRIAFQRSVAFVRADESRVLPRFLYHAVGSPEYVQQLVRRSNATAQAGLYLGELTKTRIPLPPDPDEQHRISTVLDVVDQAIATTETVIEKLKQVRAGLLHDLLTRGLDERGQLRDFGAHPEQFQEAPIGHIPKQWRSGTLGQFITSTEYGISTALGDTGVPVLRMNNLKDGEAELSNLKCTPEPVPEGLWLQPGDVLFNRTNSWEHVGRAGIWRGQLQKATFASYLVRLNPRRDQLIPDLLNLWLNWPPVQIRMRRFATPAVQQVNINPTNLRRLEAGFPSTTDEQVAIGNCIAVQDASIQSEERELAKLRGLKAGLMADLLTGRVRVPESILAAEAHV